MKNRIPSSIIFALLVASALASPCHAEIAVQKIGDTVVDEKALTIQGNFGPCINGKAFQQSAVITHAGYQYVPYYDADRWVRVARRSLPDGSWQSIRFTDYPFKSNDAHNTISIGICAQDGTIHLAFDHHVHPLRYRVSQKGIASRPDEVDWNPSLFGPVISKIDGDKPKSVTYPRFIPTPDGGLQFCWRRDGSGNGDRMLADYNPETGAWINARQIDSRKGVWQTDNGESPSRCSYPNGYDYGPEGRLHVTWVWREGAGTANHDLMYAYSEDRGKTWMNNNGQPIDGPPALESPGVKVVDIPSELGLMNTHGQAVDSQGRIHVCMWHCTGESLEAAGSKPGEHRWGPAEARRYHHYWRGKDGQWNHRELPGEVGNRPKILVDKNDNAFVIFGARERTDDLHTSANLHIVAATASSKWTDWQIIQVEPGPFVNEMLADTERWTQEGVLSIMVQETPDEPHQPTPLRILDFELTGK